MSRPVDHPWLHRFAVLTAMATLALIGLGGLVTSHGVGMAVPDWPTTYGYNMFFFPFSQWVGGVFYEHTHRLVASVVGLLTAILTGWIWVREASGWPRRLALFAIIATLGLMGVRTQSMFFVLAIGALGMIGFCRLKLHHDPRSLRWLAAIAFSAVLIQGVLGGLRVTAMKDEIGVFHGTLAQLFFSLICVIALRTSRRWQQVAESAPVGSVSSGLRRLLLVTSYLIFIQLMLGATMRHQHAGLAVPDFPLAYGKVWPPTDAESLGAINQRRTDAREFNEITAAHLRVHMSHRLTAVLVLVAVAACAWRTRRELGAQTSFTRWVWVWLGLILIQALLGAWTVWSNKAADIATLHVVIGSLSLMTGTLLTTAAFHPANAGINVAARRSKAGFEESLVRSAQTVSTI